MKERIKSTVYDYLQNPNRMRCIPIDEESGEEIKFYPPTSVYLDACKKLEIRSAEKIYKKDTYNRVCDLAKYVAKSITRRRVYLVLYVKKLDGFNEIYNKLWK